MSFILDALKKSERARQRQAGPSLFEVKIAAPRRALPAWAVVLGVLLVVVNVAVIGWMVLGRPTGRAAPVTSGAPVPHSSLEDHPARTSPSGDSLAGSPGAAPEAAASASAGRTMGRAVVNFPTDGHTARTPAAPPPSQLSTAAGDATTSDYAPAIEPAAQTQADGNLPLYKEVDSAPGKSLPSLHLDLHVYDSDPSKRFVMINMHKLTAGGSLPDGVKVISIRPDGVVLSYEGRQFLLPR